MRNKVILGFLLFSLIFPIVSAQYYEQDTALDLKIPFEVNGSNPTAAATCNVSIQYPNGTYLRNYSSMTNLNSGEFNITLGATELDAVGEYLWVASCCDGGNCGMGYDEFWITRTGKATPEGLPNLFGVMVILIFGVACFFMFLSLNFSEPGVKLFFMLASLFFLIGSVAMGVVFMDDSNVTESVSGTSGVILYALGIILIVVFFYVFIRQTVEALNLMRVRKGLDMPIGEYKVQGAY